MDVHYTDIINDGYEDYAIIFSKKPREIKLIEKIKFRPHIQTYVNKITITRETDEIRIRSVDCTNANFLSLILYYIYVRYYYWEKLVEGYLGPLCSIFSTSHEFIIISKQDVFLKSSKTYTEKK